MKIAKTNSSIDLQDLGARRRKLNLEIAILTICNFGLFFAWYLLSHQHSAKMDVQANGEYGASYLAVLLGALLLTLWLWISLVTAFVRRLRLK